MKYLIFEIDFGGHYLEYLSHLIKYSQHILSSKDSLSIILSSQYKSHLIDFYDNNKNVEVQFISDWEYEAYKKHKNFIIKNYWFCKLLKKYYNEADRIILIRALQTFPWIGFFLPNKKLINAIEYTIPGWRVNPTIKQRFGDKIKFYFYRKACFNKVFLLNEKKYQKIYNKKYKTTVFQYLPDPIIQYPRCNSTQNNSDKKVFLHAGAMAPIKGTFILIDAIKLLPQDIKNKSKFIFCGKGQTDEINNRLLECISNLSSDPSIDIEFYNGFVDENTLVSQYQKADYIIIPYLNTYQSSGNLGHAASFDKPVIGPSAGLLGHLISTNQLGLTIDSINVPNLVDVISSCVESGNLIIHGEKYVKSCSVEMFCKLLFL